MLKTISFFLVVMLLLIACNERDKSKQENSNGSEATQKTDLKIDSTFLNTFYKDNLISDSIQKETNKFYRRSNYKAAWMNKEGLNYSVSIFYNQLQNYQYDFADTSFYTKELVSILIEARKDAKKFLAKGNNFQNLDLLLTATFFKYAKKAYEGQANNLSDLEWFIPRQHKNFQSTLDSLVFKSGNDNELIPLNKAYFVLTEQLKKYRDIERKGGFPIVLDLENTYSIGSSDSNLIQVKKYFYLAGDLKNKDETSVFTDSLLKAISRFQQRMGLVISGDLDSLTKMELNKSISFRIKQIMINMERLRWLPVAMEKDFLLINIPEFKLHVIKNAKAIWATNIVVGKAATQTNIFKSKLSKIILSPYWGVPTSIANKEIVPHIKKDANYLKEKDIEVFLGNEKVNPSTINWYRYKGNVPFFFRQKPGKNNSLGRIEFLLPNIYDIYLHDTPAKELFGDTKRDFSHGCIRVADPKTLARYLVENNKEWPAKKIDEILLTDKQTVIEITPTVPIYIVYFTAWVDKDGQLNFRNDLYDLDSKLSKEIFGE